MIELLDALAEARIAWRRVERAAADLDAELYERACTARLAILDTRDRADELAFAAMEEPAA